MPNNMFNYRILHQYSSQNGFTKNFYKKKLENTIKYSPRNIIKIVFVV